MHDRQFYFNYNNSSLYRYFTSEEYNKKTTFIRETMFSRLVSQLKLTYNLYDIL